MDAGMGLRIVPTMAAACKLRSQTLPLNDRGSSHNSTPAILDTR